MKQFGRVIQLNIGNTEESIIINNLRIKFEVNKTQNAEPNEGRISIYNLNNEHRNLITTKQYDLVELYVCYRQDDLRLIFKGDIIEVENKLDNQDILTELKCADGYKAYTGKTIIKTLEAGQKDSDFLKEVKSSFDIEQSSVDLPVNPTLPRGKVFMCDTREAMNRIALNNNADWSIQDNQLIVVPKDKAIANDEGYVISSTTGMINSPKKKDDGLVVNTLCNPHYRIGALVRVESKLTEYNGDYKIKSIKHKGDILSNEWFSELELLGGSYKTIN